MKYSEYKNKYSKKSDLSDDKAYFNQLLKSGVPRAFYASPSNQSLSIVFEGVDGHFPLVGQEYSYHVYPEGEALADKLNSERFGLSVGEAMAIVGSSISWSF